MFPVKRALLIINRKAGTGQGDAVAEKLTSLFRQGLDQLSDVKIELVGNHPAARACAAEFISACEAPALVVAGGGGGTLRATIEGICDVSALDELPQHVRFAALRLGSGNVVAKQLGVPSDPTIALNGLLMNLKANRTVRSCVIRCETWTRSGDCVVHHGVTMGGLGQFGRIPSDLARWHARFPTLHKTAARFGIEKYNNVEYAVAFLIRAISCMLNPNHAEMVEIQVRNQTARFRLLSGIVMNFPINVIPFKPDVRLEDEALSLYLIANQLIPHTHRIRIEKNQRFKIRFVDRECVEFFLDEDPVTTYGQVTFGVAGSIAFVPGSDYQSGVVK
jgi:diacylglycerol kinase family enzyme